MRRYADRRDAAERPIIQYIERIGCSVQQISQDGVPDLIVGINSGFEFNLLLEVKSKSGTLTLSQSLFFISWKGHKAVVRSISDTKKVLKKYMPIRVYNCKKCGAFEKKESFSSEPLTKCPTCDILIRQIYSVPAIIFKGNGWAGKGT